VDEVVGITQLSSSSQTVGIALTEVQTLVAPSTVTVHQSVSYLVVVFHPLWTEAVEVVTALDFGQ
jgi:hypothetical protein